MKIRIANKTDIEKVVTLVGYYRDFYEVEAQDVNAVHEFISKRLENGDSKIFLATDDNDNPVGFIQLYPSFSTVSLRPQWILNDFYVKESERCKGYGKALMNAVTEYFKNEAKGFILVTEKTNKTAKNFYENYGWETGEYDFYTYFYGC